MIHFGKLICINDSGIVLLSLRQDIAKIDILWYILN
jgi:hypothetical protein